MKEKVRGDPNLEIVWGQDSFDYMTNSPKHDARGMVWTHKPISYVATVFVHFGEYSIQTIGLRGMTDKERDALEDHLRSMGLVPWRKES